MPYVNVVDGMESAHVALSSLRARILALVEEPASATEVAAALETTRQKVNYHLEVLRKHGLVEVVETRQRRGFTERRFARKGNIVIAPDLVADRRHPEDDMSAEAVVAAASDAIRAIGVLSDRGIAHPTATMATDVTFATPKDLMRFLDGVAELASQFDQPGDGLTMRISLLAHANQGDKK